MDLDYCKNIECSEYSVKNTIFCQNCLNYVFGTINPFLKVGFLVMKQKKLN